MYFFKIVFVGVPSCMFDFAAFIWIIKGWYKDLAEYDDDDDKVEEKVDFDVSSIFPPSGEENKNWEIFVVCWFKYWRKWFV